MKLTTSWQHSCKPFLGFLRCVSFLFVGKWTGWWSPVFFFWWWNLKQLKMMIDFSETVGEMIRTCPASFKNKGLKQLMFCIQEDDQIVPGSLLFFKQRYDLGEAFLITSPKINIEPEHDGWVQRVFLFISGCNHVKLPECIWAKFSNKSNTNKIDGQQVGKYKIIFPIIFLQSHKFPYNFPMAIPKIPWFNKNQRKPTTWSSPTRVQRSALGNIERSRWLEVSSWRCHGGMVC